MSEEQKANEAWNAKARERASAFEGYGNGIAATSYTAAIADLRSRLLEEMEKRRSVAVSKRDSLDSNGEHYHVDYDDWTCEIIFCDDMIDMIKTSKP